MLVLAAFILGALAALCGVWCGLLGADFSRFSEADHAPEGGAEKTRAN